MDRLLFKYGVLFGVGIVVFANFIACGARMYKVSLAEDHAKDSIPRHAHDPESQYYGIHAVDGWQKLPIPFKVSIEMQEQQVTGLLKAMQTWETAAGQKLFDFRGTDTAVGDSFRDLYTSLRDDVNGHYLDNNWTKTGKSKLVLATTIWSNVESNGDAISTADIRFNSESYLIGNSFQLDQRPDDHREIVDMESLALHELGHLLGLSHISETEDRHSIMNPSLYIGEGLATRSLSRQDVERIQRIYPCPNTCDFDEIMFKLEQLSQDNADEETEFFVDSADRSTESADQ